MLTGLPTGWRAEGGDSDGTCPEGLKPTWDEHSSEPFTHSLIRLVRRLWDGTAFAQMVPLPPASSGTLGRSLPTLCWAHFLPHKVDTGPPLPRGMSVPSSL